jgi:hypothetical protein
MWRRIYEPPKIDATPRAEAHVSAQTAGLAAGMPVKVGRTG